MEIEFLAFKEEAEKLLKDLREATDKGSLDAAEKYNGQLMSILKGKLDSTEIPYEPFKIQQGEYDAKKEKMSKEYGVSREEIFGRMRILVAFRDEDSPHIRLCGTIIGGGVESKAYVETDFGGKLVTHIMHEGDTLLLPSADLTVKKIEQDSIVANYQKDVIKLKDDSIVTGRIVKDSKNDMEVRTRGSIVTILKDEIATIPYYNHYEVAVKILITKSFPVSSGSASGTGSKTP